MRRPSSLQGRLSLFVGLGVALLWIAAAALTAEVVNRRMAAVFDSALQEAAQRILPLAAVDIFDRGDDGSTRRIAPLRPHDELLTYVVRDGGGRVLMTSHNADPADFPPFRAIGFQQTAKHRLYYDAALRGSLTIAAAEPLSYRADAAQKVWFQLAVPLLILVPLSLVGIWFAVHRTVRPLALFGEALATRGAGDLTPIPAEGLPDEIVPVAAAVNGLLGRLRRTLGAERSFTANAAHELRTPLAAALARLQRLAAETRDETARRKVGEVEVVLKRLARLSEKLMQLARAEGGRLRTEAPSDMRPILHMVIDDFQRSDGLERIEATLPDRPVPSDIDPDAFAILARNLIENALRHGSAATPVQVALTPAGLLRITNAGPVVPAQILAQLTAAFERGGAVAPGSGLGLSIVKAIAEGVGGSLSLSSPVPGGEDGFEASFALPATRSRHGTDTSSLSISGSGGPK
ncbi:MAG: HAMP domain-containing protein [Rhodobacteraceae bacterium]|nr:HAMP domain-containing protein [Paracoccaceae bacterium]